MRPSAGPRDDPPIDLAKLQPGYGAFFVTLDVQWPEQPGLAKMNVPEKVVEIYSLQKLQDTKHVQKPDLRFFTKVGTPKTILRALPAGRYEVTCLYLRDVMFMRPVGYCYPLEIVFDVSEGQVTYIGRLVLTMPKGAMTTQMKVQVVDDRATAMAALDPVHGERLALAETRLAIPAKGNEGIEFALSACPRLEAAVQDKTRVYTEEHPEIGLTLMRFVIAGRDVMDWDVAFEVLQTRRVDEPATPSAWLERYRSMTDPVCPSEWQVLAETPQSVTFERRSPDCPPHVAQHGLQRVLYGNSCRLGADLHAERRLRRADPPGMLGAARVRPGRSEVNPAWSTAIPPCANFAAARSRATAAPVR